MADAKLSALTAVSVPALDDLAYLVDVSDTTDDAAGSSRQIGLYRLLGMLNHVCQGRLTLTSGTAVTTSDVTGATSVYFTPYNGNLISVYDGTRWKLYTFTERTLALGTLTSALPYDVFIYDNAGTLTLEATAWTNDTTRATALTTQDGVYVKTGATTRRYLGTFRTTSTTTTEDSYGGASQSGGKRFLWNLYNQVPRTLGVKDTTDSWTYATATWRQANAASGNKVEYVCGLNLTPIRATAYGCAEIGGASAGCSGVGIDATNANSALIFVENAMNTGAGRSVIPASYVGYPTGVGYHYVAWLEYTRSGTVQYDGDLGVASIQTGLIAEVMA